MFAFIYYQFYLIIFYDSAVLCTEIFQWQTADPSASFHDDIRLLSVLQRDV